MKISTCLCLLGFLACLSCKSDAKSGEAERTDLHVVAKPDMQGKSSERMPISDVTTRFRFRGKPCEAQVFRTPDETLPRVKDEEGNEYVDNRITLRITSEGKTLVDRSFTKDNFASVVEPRFLQHSIFEGLVYDTVTSQGVVFAASVSYPQSDLYVPIRLTLTSGGHIAMETEDLLDTYTDGGE